jgi:hypothetical protein
MDRRNRGSDCLIIARKRYASFFRNLATVVELSQKRQRACDPSGLEGAAISSAATGAAEHNRARGADLV